MDRLLLDIFLDPYENTPRKLWLDLDATDDPRHGYQEGRFILVYVRIYCGRPLYTLCGEHLLCARLRPSHQDDAVGSVEELEQIPSHVRERWPKARIVIRSDYGFCRDTITSWREDHWVGYVLVRARNK